MPSDSIRPSLCSLVLSEVWLSKNFPCEHCQKKGHKSENCRNRPGSSQPPQVSVPSAQLTTTIRPQPLEFQTENNPQGDDVSQVIHIHDLFRLELYLTEQGVIQYPAADCVSQFWPNHTPPSGWSTCRQGRQSKAYSICFSDRSMWRTIDCHSNSAGKHRSPD